MEMYPMWIGGEKVTGKREAEVKNPFDNKTIGKITFADSNIFAKAVDEAEKGFEISRKLPAWERAEILYRAAEIMKKRKEELVMTIVNEAGKPYKFAVGEVNRGIENTIFAAEQAKNIYGEVIPMDASAGGVGKTGYYRWEPVGIVFGVVPFNFPLNLMLHKVLPAIAAGNSVIIKPSTYTPITSYILGEILKEAGLPDGIYNTIYGMGGEIGKMMVAEPRIKVISFTGSYEVGRWISERAAMKRILLEMGNNSPVIVDSDANLEKTVKRLAIGAYAYAGQICISVQRIYVNKKFYKKFVDKFLEEAESTPAGDPKDPETVVGPLIDEKEFYRIVFWVNDAATEGADVLPSIKGDNNVLHPIVLLNTNHRMNVVSKEVFGPVVSIMKYSNFEEAVSLANDTVYGLQVGVYANDINKINYAVEKLKFAGVIINDYPTFRVDHMPYGGIKNSGMGREGVRYSIKEMMEMKLVVIQDI